MGKISERSTDELHGILYEYVLRQKAEGGKTQEEIAEEMGIKRHLLNRAIRFRPLREALEKGVAFVEKAQKRKR